jgi:hypothetical protein
MYIHFANENEIKNGFYWKLHQPSGCRPIKNIPSPFTPKANKQLNLITHYNPENKNQCPYCKKSLPKGYIQLI